MRPARGQRWPLHCGFHRARGRAVRSSMLLAALRASAAARISLEYFFQILRARLLRRRLSTRRSSTAFCWRAIWRCSMRRVRESPVRVARQPARVADHHVHFAHFACRLAHRFNRLEQATRFFALHLRQDGDDRLHPSRGGAQLVNLSGRRVFGQALESLC